MRKDKMIELLKTNRRKYLSVINEKIQDFSYRSERYNQKFSIAIGLCNEDVSLSSFSSYTRQTDEFIILEDNLCCIVLDCAPQGSGIKAATNMLSGFQHNYFGKTLYSSVVCSSEHSSSTQMVHQLFDVLEYSIANNMDNMVVDPEQMMMAY